jgi:hypothetical protein
MPGHDEHYVHRHKHPAPPIMSAVMAVPSRDSDTIVSMWVVEAVAVVS